VGTSLKNDETFRRTLIRFSISLKRQYEVVTLSQGDLSALRQVIPYLTPELLDALENPFRDADRIAHRDSTEKRLDAFFGNQEKTIDVSPTASRVCDAHKDWVHDSSAKLGAIGTSKLATSLPRTR
jgi:hypothetical protein